MNYYVINVANLAYDHQFNDKLSAGLSATPYVSLAETVSVAEQKRAEFRELLAQKMTMGAAAVRDLGNLYSAALPVWLASGFEEAAKKGLELVDRKRLGPSPTVDPGLLQRRVEPRRRPSGRGQDRVAERLPSLGERGLRQTQENPWDTIEQRYPIGACVKGVVRNLTTGAIAGDDDEAVQICVSVPVGDVEIDI
jgi:hypothetical protein